MNKNQTISGSSSDCVRIHRHRRIHPLFAILLAVAWIRPGFAQTIYFPNTPLILSPSAPSAVILGIDNSGSMDFEASFTANDGAGWWYAGNEADDPLCPTGAFTGCGSDGKSDVATSGVPNFNIHGHNDSAWHKFVYLFPNGSAASQGGRVYGDTGNHYAWPPLPAFAWSRSASYNRSYFDPAQHYSPWTLADGSHRADANPAAALADPSLESSLTFDLTQDIAGNKSAVANASCASLKNPTTTDWNFRVYTGMILPAGLCFKRSTENAATWTQLTDTLTVDAQPDGNQLDGQSIAIRYFPATFYLPHGATLPKDYGYAQAPLNTGRGPSGELLDGYEIKPDHFIDAVHYTAAINNFANWFSYFRKRSLAAKSAIDQTLNTANDLQIGAFPFNDNAGNPWAADLTFSSLTNPSQRQALYAQINAIRSQGGTPTRQQLRWIGQQFRRTDAGSPIRDACQRNYALVITDGFADAGLLDHLSETHCPLNADQGQGKPYQDSTSGTMADEARCDYSVPLQPANRFAWGAVPIPASCNTPNHDPALDCNANLHETVLGISLNTAGMIYGVDAAASNAPYQNAPTWPNTTALNTQNSPSQMDDLWHATLNSHGTMWNASNAAELQSSLGAAMASINANIAASSTITLNGRTVNAQAQAQAQTQAQTQAFQARFNSGDWSGQLLDFPISSGANGPCPDQTIGQVCAAKWDAGTTLTSQAPSQRTILTYNLDLKSGTAFEWNDTLGASNQSLLNLNPLSMQTDDLGSQRLAYLRGDRSFENPASNPQFRPRNSLLGDIVDSNPVYVGSPAFNYSFDHYSAFKQNNQNRTPMVYVSANDGMLHGFRASDGQELLAYVPGSLYGRSNSQQTNLVAPKLSELTAPSYSHVFTADGALTEGDAYWNGQWHSLLVGGLRSGGQGIFALDVTDPQQFSESHAAQTVLWEFSDTDDADLGLTFSRPTIGKMHNGQWAVIVGNGYNNTAADGASSATGQAALYILFVNHSGSTWTLNSNTSYIKLPVNVGTPTAPNGLASPTAVDIDGDGVIDRIYAGDLRGNLWRFDVDSADASQWHIAYSGKPFFTASDAAGNRLPITSSVEVGPNPLTAPTEDVIVYFGTGKFLETSDNRRDSQNTQSLFAVFDENTATPIAGRSQLLTQTIQSESTSSSDQYRITSQNKLDPALKLGWVMDLKSASSTNNNGERVVEAPQLRGGRVIFTSLIPSADPCAANGQENQPGWQQGWLMELDAASGAAITKPIFDIDHNGQITSADTLAGTNPSGLLINDGIPSQPAIAGIDPQKEVKLISQSNGQIRSVLESTTTRSGRLSWREISP